jgi:membrane fusion protein, multidrug efflux system
MRLVRLQTRQFKWTSICTLTIALSSILSSCNSAQQKTVADHDGKNQAIPEMAVVPIQALTLSRQLNFPGELLSYQDVAMYPKVEGFVKWIGVDRGSVVRKGQTLVVVFAPELQAKTQEAQSKVQSERGALMQCRSKLESAIASVGEGQAKLDADEATHSRLKKASATPGVVAEVDLEVAGKQVQGDREHLKALKDATDAARSMVASQEDNLQAAQQFLQSVKDMQEYLTIKAPFDGVITSRDVHEGSLVSPSSPKQPMIRLQEISRLRLVVPVPEAAVAGVSVGKQVEFSVPAYPSRRFWGTIARPGRALDQQTRTMPVELDVNNASGILAPGMFPQVHWLVTRPYKTLFVPAMSVVTNLERTFVIKVNNGVTQCVSVSKGQPMGNLIEVFGSINAGDQVIGRASDDIKDGTRVATRPAAISDITPGARTGAGE